MNISFMGILAIVFITLKLTGVIAWSWWLVLLPLYIGFALMAVVLIAGGTLAGLAAMFSRK